MKTFSDELINNQQTCLWSSSSKKEKTTEGCSNKIICEGRDLKNGIYLHKYSFKFFEVRIMFEEKSNVAWWNFQLMMK